MFDCAEGGTRGLLRLVGTGGAEEELGRSKRRKGEQQEESRRGSGKVL